MNLLKILLIVLVTVSSKTVLFSQLSLEPVISYVYLQQNNLSGVCLGNDFVFCNNNHKLIIGTDFILGKGNRGIDNSDYDKLVYSYGDYNPVYPKSLMGIAPIQYKFPIELDPITSKTTQISLRFAYSYKLQSKYSNIYLSIGPYISYVSSNYLIGVFEDTEIDFYQFGSGRYRGTESFDVVLPIYLRYINIGFYSEVQYMFKIKERYPFGLSFKYHYGRYKSGLFSMGIIVDINEL